MNKYTETDHITLYESIRRRYDSGESMFSIAENVHYCQGLTITKSKELVSRIVYEHLISLRRSKMG